MFKVMFNFIKNIGPTEMVLIGLILTLFLGPKIVNWLARTSGETLREIKKAKKTFSESLQEDEPAST